MDVLAGCLGSNPSSCYRSLKMQKNTPQINEKPHRSKPPNFFLAMFLLAPLHENYSLVLHLEKRERKSWECGDV